MAALQRGNKGGFRVLLEDKYDRWAADLLELSKCRKGWLPNRRDAEKLLKQIRQISHDLSVRSSYHNHQPKGDRQ